MTDITESDIKVHFFLSGKLPDNETHTAYLKIPCDGVNEAETLKQQIIQSLQTAKIFDSMQTEIARNFDIDDIIWNHGDYDFKKWFAKLGKLQSQHKKLVDAIQNLIKDYQWELPDTFYPKLQNLLKECNS